MFKAVGDPVFDKFALPDRSVTTNAAAPKALEPKAHVPPSSPCRLAPLMGLSLKALLPAALRRRRIAGGVYRRRRLARSPLGRRPLSRRQHEPACFLLRPTAELVKWPLPFESIRIAMLALLYVAFPSPLPRHSRCE
ncbi:hypothetical protein AXG93_1669s1010 [Marchantia polymorpha subsp. ruderalis]|uniref:Uncharacterized protein n=1 Tax=Marchantia polymorpha subsp. ruderalis TaxID=1480154 RepID=A0A176W541_MARPO|nr:hypothetical protein AXG93_1669s1010 [Marchantia polymorpha subsp. ruderalis]